jgi:polyhydroxyalkanoate synthase
MANVAKNRAALSRTGSVKHFGLHAFDYVSNAIDRRLSPDTMVLSDQTPHRVIFHDGMVSVRYYPPLDTGTIQIESERLTVSRSVHAVPILLVPPLGVSAWIFDILQTRSLVKYFLAEGFAVYMVDWGEPDASHSTLSLEQYVSHWMPIAVDEVLRYSQSPKVSLLGYCLGGLLCLLYAAQEAQKASEKGVSSSVQNLITIASPIDFHQSGVLGRAMGFASRPLNALGRILNRSLHQVSPDKFHVPGRRLSRYFKLFNPLSNISSYLDLLVHMADREYVSTQLTLSRWFNDMLDYPGAVMQHIFVNMWVNNQMAKTGSLKFGQTKIELKYIKAPLLAFAGRTDKIVSVDAARKILDVVGSRDKAFEVVPGGHAGVFSGAKAPVQAWKKSAQWLARRSDLG